MIRSCFLFIFLVFITSKIQAQSGWNWLNPKPQGNHLNGVQMLNETNIVAVAAAGTIIRTSNGGVSWRLQRSRTNLNLLGIHFVHPDTGFVVGDSGLVLKTSNAGQAWFRQNTGTNARLLSVHFLNGRLGWISSANGTIRKTTNGGLSWNSQITQTDSAITKVRFLNSNIGWAIGEGGKILKTTNGGSLWNVQNSNATTLLKDISILDSGTCFIVGADGMILKTTNGGTNWLDQQSNSSIDLNSIAFVSSDTLLVSGGSTTQGTVLLKTVDGGANWLEADAIPDFPLYAVSVSQSRFGLAVGLNGYLFKTEDQFATATNLRTGFRDDFSDILFLNSDTGFVIGSASGTGSVLKSTNGGNSWNQTNLDLPILFPFGIEFVSNTTGFLCGSGGQIFKSTNRGDNWTELINGTSTLRSISFANENIGMAVGRDETILKTTDGGNSWNPQTSAGTGYLYAVKLVNTTLGFAGGENGIQTTTNGGNSWQQQFSTSTIFGFHFLDPQTGFAVGEGGVLLKTINGGTNWVPQASGTNFDLFKVQFSSAQNGIISGDSGLVLRTFDAGTSWQRQISYNQASLNGAFLVNDTVGFICGTNGTILNTTSGGNTCPDADFNYKGVFLPGKFCQNDTLTQSLYFDGTPGGVFSATPNGLNISPSTGIINPIQSTPGNYLVRYQVTPPNGCPIQTFSATAQIQPLTFIPRARLEVTRPPYFIPSGDVFIPCQGDTMLTRARNRFADYGFAWYKDNRLLPDTTQELKVASSGLYAVKYRDQACAGSFFDTVQIDFSAAKRPLLPGLIVSDPVATCNDNFTLETVALAGVNYQWIGEPAGNPVPGQNGNSITTNQIGTYRLQVDSLGCKSLSASISILPVNADTLLPSIYRVNTKGISIPEERNEIVWDGLNYDTNTVKRILIYRAAAGDFAYTLIAEVPSADTIFRDQGVDPGSKAYTYKISAKQLCGSELFFTPTSSLQGSINLELSTQVGQNYVLRWTEPKDYVVKKYRVYKGNSYNNLLLLTDSLPGFITSFIDESPGPGLLFYRVEAEAEEPSLPWGSIQASVRKASSNTRNSLEVRCDSCVIVKNVFSTLPQTDFRYYPNPHEDYFIIEGGLKGDLTSLVIYNPAGKQIYKDTWEGFQSKRITLNAPLGMYYGALQYPGTKEWFRIQKLK